MKIKKPYKGDPNGAFVLESPKDTLQMTLLKGSRHHELLAQVWFGPKSAGPPGHVHGGCQAAVLDEMMGATAWHWRLSVVARKIDVEFLKMVPLKKTYQARGQVLKQEGRKVFVEAEIFDDTAIYSKSKGLFVQLTEKQMAELAAKQPGASATGPGSGFE